LNQLTISHHNTPDKVQQHCYKNCARAPYMPDRATVPSNV